MQFYSQVVLLLIAGALLAGRVQCLPSGPPVDLNRNRVCNEMLPDHGGNTPQDGNGGYTISTDLPRISNSAYSYTAGGTYNLTLSGGTFQGFLVIAHVPGQPLMLIGQFANVSENQQIIDCDTALGVNTQAAIGHMDRVNDTSTNFTWTAPSDSNGTVDFRFTVVQQFDTFYVAQSAAQTSDEPIVAPPPPMRNPEDYRLTFRTPANCLLADCNVFVGIDTNVDNPAFLDITMQGVADGWLAVGFSPTQSMFDADVVGCIRNPADDNVMAIDTWNPADMRNNIRDTTQDVVLFNSSFENGIISCTFAKPINGSDPATQDRSLAIDSFIIYGYRGIANPADDIMRFPVHDVTPVSSPLLNPLTGNNQPFFGVTVPMRDPEDYRLTFRTPPGCNVSNCTTFVGIDTNTGNNGVLDIYMEGEALGWVAVGFTETRNMFAADVVACNRDPTNDTIEALDTYNPAVGRANNVDVRQNVFLFNSSFNDSRIICTVGKEIAPSDPAPQDINLNSELFVLWGIRANDSMAGRLLTHRPDGNPAAGNPAASQEQVNPAGIVLATPVRAPLLYRLIFRDPPNCDPSTCNIFVGIDTNTGNSGFLDIYIEGNSQGWVAVGFSDTQNMLSADVVGCNRDPNNNDMVEVVDTWNLDQGRGNVLDVTQDVMRFTSNFNNGRISCTVAKQIAPSDANQDLNLNASLFIMYGVGPTGTGANALPSHLIGAGNNPLLSQQRLNPAVDGGLATPVRAPLDYRIILRDPPNCDPSMCAIFVGISNNTGDPSFLDIYMEGIAQGWVAVGFSDSQNMFSADVVGCNRDANNNNMVEVVDTWNLDQSRGNTLDETQDVMLFSSDFNNNRISCTVAKQIAASDANQDLDLNVALFIMYGVGPTGTGVAALRTHITGAGNNPLLSQQRLNPAVDVANVVNDFPMVQLLRAHGILMLIAWPLLAVSGIFFAAWMRPALPNGEWFQIHRAFLLSSLFVGAIGFILAFVAHANSNPRGLINLESDNPVGTAHFAIGIIVMFLHILNPIISACRCHPGDKYRWVFNLIHGTAVGLLVEILALTNIALGLVQFGPSSFFADSNRLTIFWVYIGFLIFFLVVIGVLFLVFTLLSIFSQDDDRSKTAPSLIKPLIGSGSDMGHKPVPTSEGVELAVPGQKPTIVQSNDSEKPKVPSKDSPLRWGALTIFLAVNITMMLVLIILVAIE